MEKKTNPLLGRWRVTKTELWDWEDLDLLGPATVEFSEDGIGYLRLGALEAESDHRIRHRRSGWRAEFSWSGFDDGTPVSGRGWARLEEGGKLKGKLFIHLGDEARFEARRE